MGSEILFFPHQFFVCDLPSELLKQAKASTKSKLNLDLIHEKKVSIRVTGVDLLQSKAGFDDGHLIAILLLTKSLIIAGQWN